MKIKRLKLWQWMIEYAHGCQGLLKNEHQQRSFDKQYPYLSVSHPFEFMSKLSDGFYLLNNSTCFFVVNKHAYKHDCETFNYEITLIKNMENLPSGRQLDVLKKIEYSIYGKLSTKTQNMLLGMYMWKRDLKLKTESIRKIKEMRLRLQTTKPEK